MIKVTRLDGSEMYLNEDLIELIEETPDTHITLTNGNRYVIRERTAVLLERIAAFRAKILSRASYRPGKKYLRRTDCGSSRPWD